MGNYFITATGTGIGKTYISAALTESLRREGRKVAAIKPIVSGFDAAKVEESDTGILLKAQGLEITPQNIESISPWRFTDPLSPDMAAENEKRTIPINDLLSFCRKGRGTEYTLIEGAGGVMTTIGVGYTVLDLIDALNAKIILVTGSYLGTISHTLTAYHAIKARRLNVHTIIMSESESSPVPPERTILTLKEFLPNDISIHFLKRGVPQDITGIL